MMRAKLLCQSSVVSVSRLDHQPDTVHQDMGEEVAESFAVNFVEAGCFRLSAYGCSWRLTPGSVFVSQPGDVRDYSHDEEFPTDVCASVSFTPEFIEGCTDGASLLPAAALILQLPTNRLAFLKLRLDAMIGMTEQLALDDFAYELIAAIRTVGRTLNNERPYGARQLNWYAERVEAVRALLETQYAESQSLASLAAGVGMSAFNFARVFRQLTGLPPHRYLVQVRLNRALEMLRDGSPVTDVCYAVGYSNLSHFTRSFRRRFGFQPSTLKRVQRHAS
jgi:AraC family transcriptional regulator